MRINFKNQHILNFMRNFIKVLSAAVIGTLCATTADAQIVYPYVMDFENTNPATKAYASTDTIVGNNLKWVMPGTYLGTPVSGSDFYNDAKSARVRLTNNSTGTQGYLEMVEDLPLGADTLSFYVAMYGSETGDSVLVQYSTNQGATWTNLSQVAITGTHSAGQKVTLIPNISSPIRFKFSKVKSTNVRINLDDIRVTPAAQATNLVLTNFSPTGMVHPSTDVITMTFNEDVALGTGNITLFEAGAGSVQYDVTTSQDVSVVNNVVTISNVALQPNKSYYVRYDSAAIVGDVSGLKAPGIYDNTTWTFSTTALALQNFEENFDNCNASAMGIFVAESLAGTQTWFCDTYNDTTSNFNPPYVTINGGTGSASFENEDYLITSIPVDLSGMDVEKVNLYYAEKRRFGGNGVTRGIYYSADYAGNAATATWTAIESNLEAIATTGTFIRRTKDITSKIDVTKPVYLAFKYESIEDADTSVNWSWSLDDIEMEVIEKGTAINPLKANSIYMDVLGIARGGEVNVRVASVEDMTAQLTVYDISGRKVYTQPAALKTGTQVVTIHNVNLNAGMYVIKLDSSKGSKVVKFIAE